MQRGVSSALLVFGLATAALAQRPVGEPGDPLLAWSAFEAQHGAGMFQSEINPATGTPEAIYGEGLRVASRVEGLDHARSLASQVLEQHAALLGRGGSTFHEQIAQRVSRLYILVYDQRFQGLEVVSGRADVRLNENGVVSMFGSKAVPIPEKFSLVADIPQELAWAVAHAHLSVVAPSDRVAQAELVIHADVEAAERTTPRLAWRVKVDVREDEKLTVGRVYVDARSGEVIAFQDDVHRCWAGHTHVRGECNHAEAGLESESESAGPGTLSGNVMAWMNMGDPLTARTNRPVQGVRVNAPGVGSAFTDANGDFSIPYAGVTPVNLTVNFASGNSEYVNGGIDALQGVPVSTSTLATPGVPAQLQLLAANPVEFDWSQTTVFWHTDDVQRWVRSITGPISTSRINIANVRATVNRASTCNAFYTGNTINFYATGGTCNMTGFNSVVYHEWGHGADDAFGGISQTDGLSEGWGDILSTFRLGDPIVGRNFTTSGGIVRDARNSFTYPAGGGVHQQGQTWMGFAWTLRNNLIALYGAAGGAAIADAIVVGTLPANATNQPNAVREVFLLDDNDGNLNNGTPNCASILAAAQSRLLPTPISRCTGLGSFTAYGSACPGSGSLPGTCASLNGNGGTFGSTTFANEYAYGHQAASAGVLVGFDLYTRSTTGNNETVEVRVYPAATPGGTTPSTTALATGTITVGTALAFYPATLGTPINFAAGDRLWIAQRESTRILRSALSSGGTVQTLPTYFRLTATGTTWAASSVNQPAWRWNCQAGPGAQPALSTSVEPLIGQNFTLQLNQARASSGVFLAIGGSDQFWGPLPLPFDLQPLGASNCFVNASLDILVPGASNSSGSASWPIAIPNDGTLVGGRLYTQALVLDPANALGIVTSNGGAVLIGQP
ncbi:MAG: PepSY domain-containing protein [Planctomycetes bacterium]|nr:PepSY domain-containing protein [Planctomycetota bacterium]